MDKNIRRQNIPPYIKKVIAMCVIRGYTIEEAIILCKLLMKNKQ